jgi:hypothetical protein
MNFNAHGQRPMIPLKWRIALLLFAGVLSLSTISILKNRQLHFMGGMAEEYFGMGVNLYYHGQLSPTLTGARIFRPPGYPFFIAVALRVWGGLPDQAEGLFTREDLHQTRLNAFRAVCLAQGFLLSLTTVILFLYLATYLRLRNAAVLAALFGCNPYLIILTGLLHYAIVHIFLTVVSIYLLSNVMEKGPDKYGANVILAGVFWGVTTLTRPISLLLPPFVLFMFLIKFQQRWRPLVKSCILFAVGMGLTILPNAIHNYALTGRIIPVNAQSSIALWGATVKKLARNPNHYRWWELGANEGMRIYRNVTGSDHYSYTRYVNHIIQLEDEFKKEAFNNLRLKPGVYIHNFWVDFLTFNLDINSVFIKIFQAIQNPDVRFNKKWLEVGDPQNFYSSARANGFKYNVYLLTLFSFIGVGFALKQKDPSLLVPGMVYLCFCLAHSLTYMDLMYYYIKLPFLYMFSGYLVNAVDHKLIRVHIAGARISAAIIINGVLVIFGLWLVTVIFLI